MCRIQHVMCTRKSGIALHKSWPGKERVASSDRDSPDTVHTRLFGQKFPEPPPNNKRFRAGLHNFANMDVPFVT